MEYTFKIPLVPESINSLYKINYIHRTIYLSEDGRAFKYQAKLFIPRMIYPDETLFEVSVQYHADWYYKNGNVKRADSPNLDKLIIDTLFETIGVDDSHLWIWHSSKVQETKERYTMVTVKDLPCTHTT